MSLYQQWYVVFPRGDKSRLDVALLFDYEEDQWALASRRHFEEEKEAIQYAKQLATSHNKNYTGPPDPDNKHDYLD
jgi:hypothetical protein